MKVLVKMLRHVGEWPAGAEVEVDEAIAKVLCQKTVLEKGGYKEEVQKAMLMSEVKELETRPVDPKKVTQHELSLMGRRNIVPTEINSALQKKLDKAAAKAKEDAENEGFVADVPKKKNKGA